MYRLSIGTQAGFFILFISNIIYFSNITHTSSVYYPQLLSNFNTAQILSYLSVFYFAILFVQICFSLFQSMSLNRKIHSSENLSATEWINFTEKWMAKLNISGKVKIVSGNKFSSPFTKGFFKPIIYLPISIFTSLTPVQIEAIILHELIHIKQYDYLIIIIQNIIEKILYFNPFTRLIGNIARKEREILCDDLVTRYYDKFEYSSALYSLATYNEEYAIAASARGNSSTELLDRIKIIHGIKSDKPTLNIAKLMVITFSILLITFVLPNKESLLHSPVAENIPQPQLASLQEDIPAEPRNLLSSTRDEPVTPKPIYKPQKEIKTEKKIASKVAEKTDNQYIVRNKTEKEEEKITPETKPFSLEITAHNNSAELEAVFKKINMLLQNESLQYQAQNVANVFTAEGSFSTAYNYVITENYIVEIEQNNAVTKIKLSENNKQEALNKVN